MAMPGDSGSGRTTPIWRSALALGLIAVIGTVVLAGVNQLTRQRIADQEERAALELLSQVVSPDRYDNPLHLDRVSVASGLGPITVYRARMAGEPVALVMKLATQKGYNGRIELLVGINTDGTLSGVRVTAHRETPGLGDDIELQKSDWILGFNGRSLGDPPREEWAVKKDGGVFDQFTGATITPRAVVDAVRGALEYHANHRERLFAAPAETALTQPQPRTD